MSARGFCHDAAVPERDGRVPDFAPDPSRALVALSGGVDSSVCVRLLQREGYAVSAVVMRMSELHESTVEAARESARALGISLTELDLREEFEREIIDDFAAEYSRGRTPNPCVRCNPRVKFRHLLAEADRQGCAWIATGHYARVRRKDGEGQADGEALLLRGESKARDQSYMLYRLPQAALRRLLLPIGSLEKPEVRRIAGELGLSCADRPDSQENCFVEGGDYAAFLERRMGAQPPGDFVGPDGVVCGRHRGILHYTVGQRKGLGLALGRPVFIRAIDAAQNRIYLAEAGGDAVSEAMIARLAVVSGKPWVAPFCAQAKIRSAAQPVPARVFPLDGERARVEFETPQRAVAPGQSLVLYEGERVLGGGILEDGE